MHKNEHVLGFIMAGGNGSRLKILTKERCKPGLDFLGYCKIFDFAASNLVNTGIPVSLVATQFKKESLCRYIKEKWEFNGSNSRFEIVCPDEDMDNAMKFDGTADSVRKSIDRIDRYNPDIIVILGADHIYFMNYKDAITQHKINNADITIMTSVVPDDKVSDFGIVKVDGYGRIVDFVEKPTDQDVIDDFRLSSGIKCRMCIEDPDKNFLASMGNYIFNWDRLRNFLDYEGADFGKDIIPAIKANGGNLYAHIFNGSWRDVGKIQDYYTSNMEFAGKPISLLKSWIGLPEISFSVPQIDNSSFIKKTVLNSGDVIGERNVIANSVLGHNIITEEKCALDHCILFGAETDEGRGISREKDAIRIGKGSRLNYVILDENVSIGDYVDVNPQNGTPEKRSEILQNVGLKPYEKLGEGMLEGDFYIEPQTGILVIGKQNCIDQAKPILPDGSKI